jgi:predicted transposase/invertase (TIGR01784 family)
MAINQNVIETALMDGIEQGKLEEKRAIAKGMLAEGLKVEIITKLTGLIRDEIEHLQQI